MTVHALALTNKFPLQERAGVLVRQTNVLSETVFCSCYRSQKRFLFKTVTVHAFSTRSEQISISFFVQNRSTEVQQYTALLYAQLLIVKRAASAACLKKNDKRPRVAEYIRQRKATSGQWRWAHWSPWILDIWRPVNGDGHGTEGKTQIRSKAALTVHNEASTFFFLCGNGIGKKNEVEWFGKATVRRTEFPAAGEASEATLIPSVKEGTFGSSGFLSPRGHLHRGEDVTVHVWHKPVELVHSFSFCSCVYFCLYGPFNCTSCHTFSWQRYVFSLCSSGLISTLLVLPTIYLYESLLQLWYNA